MADFAGNMFLGVDHRDPLTLCLELVDRVGHIDELVCLLIKYLKGTM